ncbi:MAG: S16 family serine protease [Candidatus Micrarchaeia archaeon]
MDKKQKNKKKFDIIIISLLAILLIAILTIPISSQTYESSIYAPAVILSNNTGILTIISLNVGKGNGTVSIKGPAVVGNSTLASATTGAEYASKYLGLNFSNYNFTYYISGNDTNVSVSGPSGGAAFTLLALSALSNKPLNHNFTITGTISSSGAIGQIGGVFDKIDAAKKHNLSFVLVPNASNDNLVYYIAQSAFNIPVIEVSNISQTYQYAFGNPSRAELNAHSVKLNLYTKLNLNVGNAPYQCTGSCNYSAFSKLVNYTFNMTNSSIDELSSNPNFINATEQLKASMLQNAQLERKGYLYLSADLAFLNFLDANYLNSYNVTRASGFSEIQSLNNYCSSLSIPQLNTNNYEFVIGGELRQQWGEETISSLLSTYNQTDTTTDGVLENMQLAGTAYAWCSAAQEMYKLGSTMNGESIMPNANLSAIAESRIKRASAYGNSTYLIGAENAYAAQNYPLSIFEADYAYAMQTAAQYANANPSNAINRTFALSANATYGIWPTEFADESYFYAKNAELASSNSSAMLNYAVNGYTTAVLASLLSNDTKIIMQNMIPGSFVQKLNTTKPITVTTPTVQNQSAISRLNTSITSLSTLTQLAYKELNNSINEIYDAFIVFAVIVVTFLVLIVYQLIKVNAKIDKLKEKEEKEEKKGRQIKRR